MESLIFIIERITNNRMIQQQVEELRFEDVFIQKIKAKALKTNKIRDWLTLLKAYQQNNKMKQKDQAIQQMHFKFILNQDFWIQEISRKYSQSHISEKDINFMFLSMDDGYYQHAADRLYEVVYTYLILGAQSDQKKLKLKPNFLISKIQKLISIFKREKNYFPALRQYYKKVGNQKKIREMYIRELGMGYDNLDVIYDEYVLWETDQDKLRKSGQIYAKSKQAFEYWYQQGLGNFDKLNNDEKLQFDSHFYQKLIENLESETQKLRYYRIFCLRRHQLTNQYFEKLQFIHKFDEEYVIKSYKSVIEIIPEIQMGYLRFLVRRINKHVLQTQSEEYNHSWGKNVQFFRDQISALLNKPRQTPKTEESTRQLYINFWIDVQVSLIKDKTYICQLFEILLQSKRTVEAYGKYSQCMIRLGHYSEAKNILKRNCKCNKYDYQAYKLYQNFIDVYGNITDAIQFRKLKILQKDEKKEQEVKRKIADQSNVQQKGREHVEVRKEQDLERKKQNKQVFENSHIRGERSPNQQKSQVQIQSNRRQEKKRVSGFGNQKVEEAIAFIRQESSKLDIKYNNQQNSQKKQIKEQHFNENSSESKKRMHADSGNTIFIKGFPNTFRESDIRGLIILQDKIKEIRLIQKKGYYQNYCYVQMNSFEDAHAQIQLNPNKNIYTIAISNPQSAQRDEATLFLYGLPHSSTKQKIMQVFPEEKHQIVEIRLKLDENRNIAYVVFETEQIKKGVFQKYEKKELSIEGKKIFMKQSKSLKELKEREREREKRIYRVIIIKNLAHKAKQRDVVEFFKDYSIEDVYVPEGQNGRSKGIGFVKFKEQSEFQKVLQIRNGSIKGRRIEIYRSQRQIQRPKQKEKKEVDNNFFNTMFK